MMRRARMAWGLVGAADDLASRRTLASYFLRRALPVKSTSSSGRLLEFRLGQVDWSVAEESSHLGGIHDVFLGREYDAFRGFRASPSWTVLDIGANIGAYTLWQYRNMGGQGRIVAVEATPETFERLTNQLQRNQATDVVSPVHAAVWRESGTVEIRTSSRTSSTSGIAETLDDSLLAGTVAIEVPALSLDDLLDANGIAHVDVVKVDVEGAELELLRGASPDALARIDRLVVEFDDGTFDPLVDVLAAAGFDLLGQARSVGYFAATDR